MGAKLFVIEIIDDARVQCAEATTGRLSEEYIADLVEPAEESQ